MAERARNIVVGYDDSEASRRALDRAATLAGYGSTLTVVNVAPRPGMENGNVLDRARQRLLRKLVSATYLRPVGDPADELVAAAEAADADLVVVGRRNGVDVRRLLLGSVSAKVVRTAPCDVLVVR